MVKPRIVSIVAAIAIIAGLAGCGGQVDEVALSGTTSNAKLVSLSVTPTNSSIANGTSQDFTAVGIFSDGTTKDLTAVVTWSSSDASVATISNTLVVATLASPGKIKAVGKRVGQTRITATSGSTSDSTTLTVTSATLVSIAVTPPDPSIAPGTALQLTATGTFSDNTTQDLTAAVNWSSSDTGVVSVSNTSVSNGMATSVATGSAAVTASSGSISATTTVTVTAATLVSVAITPSNPNIARGTTRQFTASGTYSDGSMQNLTASVTWSSSNTAVASISNAAGSNGLATSVGTGSTTITAVSEGISASTTLTVTGATLSSISVAPLTASVPKGSTRQFTATGTYSDGSTQNLTASVTWSSSNTSVASISNAAGSNGLATTVASGTATISAASGGVSGTATLTVTATSTATLTWSPPTTFADGTPLNPATDLSSYKIYYGTASGVYTQSVTVTNPGNTAVTKTLNLTPGSSYYFVVTSVDTQGVESGYSMEVSKTL
jgi:uncharacterized protein YjdB